MHARLTIGNAVLMGSDVPPGQYKQPHGYSINIGVNNVAEAEHFGGMLTDRFGIPWMLNCQRAGASSLARCKLSVLNLYRGNTKGSRLKISP
jgi:PhnB protein